MCNYCSSINLYSLLCGLPAASSYVLNVTIDSSSMVTAEDCEEVIPFVVSLRRLDGGKVDLYDTVVTATIVLTGFPENVSGKITQY